MTDWAAMFSVWLKEDLSERLRFDVVFLDAGLALEIINMLHMFEPRPPPDQSG